MEIIEQSHQILTVVNRSEVLIFLEKIGRTAYKSEDKITKNSAVKFIQDIMKRGHESCIEHFNITVRFITDRGILAELTRQRLCSFTVESTRYVNYLNKGMQFIKPVLQQSDNTQDNAELWIIAISAAETCYNEMIQHGASPQEARSVLPNSLKTEIVVTANLREWRHILKLRTDKAAHPQMRALMIPLLDELKSLLPEIFGDINYD